MHKKLKDDIIQHVIKNSGTQDDGLMIFHDSIVVFTKKVFTHKELEINNSLEGYIYGIARMLWLNKLRKEGHHKLQELTPVHDHATEDSNQLVTLMKKEHNQMLHKILGSLGLNCKEVLMYWAGGFAMAEIAKILGYASEGMVRKKKHQCYKSLVEIMAKNDTFKEQLKYKP